MFPELGLWYPATRADPRALALYRRHYSCQNRTARQFVTPGACLVLLTVAGDALFVWSHSTPGLRLNGLDGACCVVFRNESAYRASALIREAERLAHARWPGVPFFTYVDPRRVRSGVPGYCFRRAGWRHTGTSKSGLLLFTKAT